MVFLRPYLSLPVDPDDAGGGLVWCGYKDGFPADPVHVDAGARLQIVQVDVAIFGDEENHVLFGAYLRSQERKKSFNLIKPFMHEWCGITFTKVASRIYVAKE